MGSLNRAFRKIQSPLIRAHPGLTRSVSSATEAAQSTGTALKTAKSSPVIKSNQPSKIKEIEARAAKKTMAELDEELRLKLEGRSGEGGEAGLELEDGRPSAMKRGVKNNMFRVI